jgi:hypothetical protein
LPHGLVDFGLLRLLKRMYTYGDRLGSSNPLVLASQSEM